MLKPRVERYDNIDSLRGLSIMAVVLAHANLYLAEYGYDLAGRIAPPLRGPLFGNGGTGMSIFFAVSGFLITHISIRRFGSLGHLSLATFYKTRFARIGPPLILLLLVLSLLDVLHVPQFTIATPSTLAGSLIAVITFQFNWYAVTHNTPPAAWGVLWSLSVEEMFYLFFPLLCIVLMKRRATAQAFVLILVCFILYGHKARITSPASPSGWLYVSYLGNMDKIALGCLVAILANYLVRTRIGERWPLGFQVAGAAILVSSIFIGPIAYVPHVLGQTGLAVIGSCLVMLGTVLHPSQGMALTAPLRWLGRNSYELYLTHQFFLVGVLSLFLRRSRRFGSVWIGVTMALTCLGGRMFALYFSEPMNRWIRSTRWQGEAKKEGAALTHPYRRHR